jgi:hypothetical protein
MKSGCFSEAPLTALIPVAEIIAENRRYNFTCQPLPDAAGQNFPQKIRPIRKAKPDA